VDGLYVLQEMKILLLTLLACIAPLHLVTADGSITLSVADMKRYLDAHLNTPNAKEIPDEELPKVFYAVAMLEGLITGLKIADETHKPEQPILERLDLKGGTKEFYQDLREFLATSPLIKEQEDGLKASTWFLMTNYTDNIQAKTSATKMWRNIAEQAGTGQPATRSQSKSEGGDKPQPESEGRSR
jgi:hypothetical protein